jgi:pyruvate/2-oxoglutarate dehydrogenase complex dihydrolipoamide dehydrogenase (E3) component
VARDIGRAERFGIGVEPAVPNVPEVHKRVQSTIAAIYEHTTPEALERRGIDVYLGPARFVDAGTLMCGDRQIEASRAVICTGARAVVPKLPGLDRVPFLTYARLFDLETLPPELVVLGAGPLGVEMAQAFGRLGAKVTIIGPAILEREEPEAQTLIRGILEREGVKVVLDRVTEARQSGNRTELRTATGWHGGDQLLVAAGRTPNVEGLDLERAGVAYDAHGIKVDKYLRTSVRHTYACGDVIGGPQFSHLAGYECFKAVRNALLPGRSTGKADVLPAVTFGDPEVARVGMTEAEARRHYGQQVAVHYRPMTKANRAVCDGDTEGFIKFVTLGRKKILGATIVASRGGEMIAEVVLAMQSGLSIDAIAGTIHAYPTWSTDVQLAAVDILTERVTSGLSGRIIRWLSHLG